MAATPEVEEQIDSIWNKLDEDHDGLISSTELYSFLKRQGLNLKTEAECLVRRNVD